MRTDMRQGDDRSMILERGMGVVSAEQLAAYQMEDKRVRVMRVLIYEGRGEQVVHQLAHSLSPGTHLVSGHVQIRIVQGDIEIVEDPNRTSCLCGSDWVASLPNGAARCGPCLTRHLQCSPEILPDIEWREGMRIREGHPADQPVGR
jgi:hypothetical protein